MKTQTFSYEIIYCLRFCITSICIYICFAKWALLAWCFTLLLLQKKESMNICTSRLDLLLICQFILPPPVSSTMYVQDMFVHNWPSWIINLILRNVDIDWPLYHYYGWFCLLIYFSGVKLF